MKVKNWNIEEQTGYKPLTTIYTDFGIAEKFGSVAIKNTYQEFIKKGGFCEADYKNATELVMALNWKIWEHYQTNETIARVYNDLWEKAQNWYFETFTKEEEQNYYYRITD